MRRRRRAFAVGAGDRRQRRAKKAVRELDFAQNRNTSRQRLFQQQVLRRHSGTGNYKIHAVKPGRLFAAQTIIDREAGEAFDLSA